ITIRDLLINSLRMRPDRIVVGECRGAETLDMLQAMNTGHEGSLSTCHANSPVDALRRLETMVLTAAVDLPSPVVREQLAAAIDLVVQLERRHGRRAVVAVDEVVPWSPLDQPTLRTVPLLDDAGAPVARSVRPTRVGGARPWWVA
ncbi:MAG: Flp pilus assembly complex ATPase component TadA, partial [Acidimicrobiales bacterium]|nr:Flp pilus assembly complex ATPase component TadA [Acidimicrobiales bacterium]